MISVIYSQDFLLHKTGMLHPERPERLTAIVEAIKAAPWAGQIDWQVPTPVAVRGEALMEILHQVHSAKYIREVEYLAKQGGGYIDGDTPISAESYDVALLAVSAWLDGVDQVLSQGQPAFVLSRPPGHHALSDRGMGFCLFSNAAIAAFYALEKHNLERVAILDWDVHHGNGTQAIVENCREIAYCSLHQSPCYPGTGYADEQGSYGNVLNLPMYPGSGTNEYLTAFESKVLPFLTEFQPNLLIVSAGYDGNVADPLASIHLHSEDFGRFTDYCLQITPRVLFGLEGGYALQELAESVVATIARCLV